MTFKYFLRDFWLLLYTGNKQHYNMGILFIVLHCFKWSQDFKFYDRINHFMKLSFADLK